MLIRSREGLGGPRAQPQDQKEKREVILTHFVLIQSKFTIFI